MRDLFGYVLNSHLVFSSHFAKQDAVDSSRVIKLFRPKFLAIEGLRRGHLVRLCAIVRSVLTRTASYSPADSGENGDKKKRKKKSKSRHGVRRRESYTKHMVSGLKISALAER
jgi:hypothetical protein